MKKVITFTLLVILGIGIGMGCATSGKSDKDLADMQDRIAREMGFDDGGEIIEIGK